MFTLYYTNIFFRIGKIIILKLLFKLKKVVPFFESLKMTKIKLTIPLF